MKKVARLGAMAGLAVAALVVTPTAAFAVDGHFFGHVTTPGKTDNSGASASGDVTFIDSNTAMYTNVLVNDTCGDGGAGDGLGAWGRAKVKFNDGTFGYGSWHKDTGGCGGGGNNVPDGALNTSKTIYSAGYQICVYDNDYQVACATTNMTVR